MSFIIDIIILFIIIILNFIKPLFNNLYKYYLINYDYFNNLDDPDYIEESSVSDELDDPDYIEESNYSNESDDSDYIEESNYSDESDDSDYIEESNYSDKLDDSDYIEESNYSDKLDDSDYIEEFDDSDYTYDLEESDYSDDLEESDYIKESVKLNRKKIYTNKEILNNIMKELKISQININKLLIYFIRLWNSDANIYFYKIGYSTNLEDRLRRLNCEYKSEWRIIIIYCFNINCPSIERDLHKNLRIKYGNINIKRYNHEKSIETYKIHYKIYNEFYKFLKKNNYIYFKSNNYSIYNHKEQIIDNNKIIILDQNIIEENYWSSK
jgi:hypothetical protein